MALSDEPPTIIPRLPNVVSHDWANAVRIVVVPEPSPHFSPLSLCSCDVVCGSFSTVGELTLLLAFLPEFAVNHAELVTILNVEPGGSSACVALLISGLGLWCSSFLSLAFSLLPLWTASRFGS